jgi:hypothetical protein
MSGANSAFLSFFPQNPPLLQAFNGSGGANLLRGATAWSSNSDVRLKNIIEPISDGLIKVNQLNSYIYTLKDDYTNMRRVGVLAQEVIKVLPEAVGVPDDPTQMMSVCYTDLIPLALVAIKELSAQNNALEQSLANVTANVSSLEARLTALESKLSS